MGCSFLRVVVLLLCGWGKWQEEGKCLWLTRMEFGPEINSKMVIGCVERYNLILLMFNNYVVNSLSEMEGRLVQIGNRKWKRVIGGGPKVRGRGASVWFCGYHLGWHVGCEHRRVYMLKGSEHYWGEMCSDWPKRKNLSATSVKIWYKQDNGTLSMVVTGKWYVVVITAHY